MEYQTIKENGEVKFVVLPIKSFQAILDRIEDEFTPRYPECGIYTAFRPGWLHECHADRIHLLCGQEWPGMT